MREAPAFSRLELQLNQFLQGKYRYRRNFFTFAVLSTATNPGGYSASKQTNIIQWSPRINFRHAIRALRYIRQM